VFKTTKPGGHFYSALARFTHVITCHQNWFHIRATYSAKQMINILRPVDCVSSLPETFPNGFSNLNDKHKELLFGINPMKKPIRDDNGLPTGAYYKVKIVPLTLLLINILSMFFLQTGGKTIIWC
jgi:hypothetical protein